MDHDDFHSTKIAEAPPLSILLTHICFSSNNFVSQARREAEAEVAALAKFTRAQEKLAQRDNMAQQQATKKGASKVVNAFDALALDESDDENSS